MSDAEARRREILARILQERAATEYDPTANWYPSLDLAAIAALDAITEQQAEQGGMLFRDKQGQYSYSVPVPGKNDSFSLRARFDSSMMDPAGIYHTHPAGERSGLFSPNDIEVAKQLMLLSYIKTLVDGQIRRFDPAASSVRMTGERGLLSPRRTARGEIVERPQQARGLLDVESGR